MPGQSCGPFSVDARVTDTRAVAHPAFRDIVRLFEVGIRQSLRAQARKRASERRSAGARARSRGGGGGGARAGGRAHGDAIQVLLRIGDQLSIKGRALHQAARLRDGRSARICAWAGGARQQAPYAVSAVRADSPLPPSLPISSHFPYTGRGEAKGCYEKPSPDPPAGYHRACVLRAANS